MQEEMAEVAMEEEPAPSTEDNPFGPIKRHPVVAVASVGMATMTVVGVTLAQRRRHEARSLSHRIRSRIPSRKSLRRIVPI